MPRLKKKVDASVSGPSPSNLSQTLTAGRSRRTIKPNPKYLNDEMVVLAGRADGSFDGSDMSEEDYEMEEDDIEELIVRKSMVSTPASVGMPKRRGRPAKQRNLDSPRTEPTKNLRKEVLKKMDYKTISISKSRHIGTPLMRDGRRKIELSVHSIESVSSDQDDSDDEDDKQDQSFDGGDEENQSVKVINPAAFKKHLVEKTILERRGSGTNKSSADSKRTGGTTEDDEDDDDFYNDSDAKMSQAEQVVPGKRPVGRPRKHPIKPQISPYARKVLLPGMKTTSGGQTLKRKAAGSDTDEENKHESQQSKMLRRSYGLKHVNSKNRSMETESDENDADESDDGRRKAIQRARSFPNLRGAGRIQKNSYYSTKQKQKLMGENSGRMNKFSAKSHNSPTITYVNVNDIIKKSKSSSDVRRKMQEEEDDSEEASEMDESKAGDKDGATQAGDRPKTNNQLVATILERKRPIAIENLQDMRRRARAVQSDVGRKKNTNSRPIDKHQRARDLGVSEILTENDIVDFEDMLQKNIVSANKPSRDPPGDPVLRGRGRPSENSRPNANAGGNKSNNNLYKSGRTIQSRQSRGGTILKQSTQPPRILNSTMKLGDTRAVSKLSATSANNHYSIDLTDPDNNVKLVSSTENVPVKRPLPGIGGYSSSGSGNTANARPGVMRENQRVTSEFRKKKITCYERWHVINCKFNDSSPKKQSVALSMVALGNVAGNIKMPSDDWSLRTVLEKRKTPPGEGDEIFTGEMQDNTISEEDKSNYEPNRIMFRRKAPSPGRFNVQYDRTVIFRNDCYTVNIDGQSCKLLAAPLGLETIDDIELLLSIVDYIDLKNGCVEVVSPIRSATDGVGFRRAAAIV